MTGEESIQEIRKVTDTVLLSFSCGKDSIAAWLALAPHFAVVPFYCYLVPGLQFVDLSLDYYENYFGTRIERLPHPSLYRMLRNFVFQPPERCAVIEEMDLPRIDYDSLAEELRKKFGLGPEVYVAAGVRAADSPARRMAVNQRGCINHKRRTFWPVWDWKKAQLLEELRRATVKLPIDYKLFGRSFDGIDYRFLEPISRELPDDYRTILEWFPLADLELFRRQHG